MTEIVCLWIKKGNKHKRLCVFLFLCCHRLLCTLTLLANANAKKPLLSFTTMHNTIIIVSFIQTRLHYIVVLCVLGLLKNRRIIGFCWGINGKRWQGRRNGLTVCVHTLTYTNEMIMMSMQLLLSPCSPSPLPRSQLFTRRYITPHVHVTFISPFSPYSLKYLFFQQNKRNERSGKNFTCQLWGWLV